MAFAARAAELKVLGAGRSAPRSAVRELLALQASDWPFMVSRGLAGPYPAERFEGHLQRLYDALGGAAGDGAPSLRNIAADADGAALLEP
jgi:1,4-alpha-glucan branching enzyme